MTFAEMIAAHGLIPRGPVVPDGKWHRCPTQSHPRKRNGSYKLALDGRIGWFADFARDSDPHTWRVESTDHSLPAFDPQRLNEERAAARRRMVQAVHKARDYYAACSPLIDGHPYLEAHGLDMTGCVGLRRDRRDRIVVPAYHVSGELMTVQCIDAEGEKRFWPGAPVKGAMFTVDRRKATITVICEGLATGLAIFAAVPTTRIVVAFNAGNLSNVAPLVGTGLTVVAADNDWETETRIGENPGVKAARDAAALIGCGVAIPADIEGSDFADMRQELFEARVEKRTRFERVENIRRAVDAAIASEITRNATFIATPQRAS
jgi:putative DNA primase/helicase